MPLAEANVSGESPLALAIDQRVSPGTTVWGTEAPAGTQVDIVRSAASAVVRIKFKTASVRLFQREPLAFVLCPHRPFRSRRVMASCKEFCARSRCHRRAGR